MTRDVRWYLVGSLVLVVLAGCGRSFFAQREAWRREAEVQCLQSGSVKQGPAVALLSPIAGPGVCGADFPLKVAALGDPAILGYADDATRPPGAIGRGALRPLPPARTGSGPPGPLDLSPPESAPAAADAADRTPPSLYPPRHPTYGESVPITPSRAEPATTQSLTAAVTPAATLACPVVSALDRWVASGIQPAARRWFGQPVVEIKQISAYSCRGMNGNPHARISEHAFGNALDIAGFVLADSRVVTIRRGWRGTPEEQGFLHDVHASACEIFSTVLGPGSNRFHYDHIHVDMMRRDSGRRVCDPAAVPGDAVAARARSRYGAARPGEFAVTGTVAARRRSEPGHARLPAARFEEDREPSNAVPGED